LTLTGLTGLSAPGGSDIKFEVFPNPVADELIITFEKEETLNLSLTFRDATGRPIWHYTGNENKLPVSLRDFASGMYLLQIRSDKTVYSHMVILK
jgi:hypothetical protein